MNSPSKFHDFKTLARAITLAENSVPGSEAMLEGLQPYAMPVIGFTGPPGAGKSTLLNALLAHLAETGKSAGLILVDPSSPFNLGAILGDRLRMSAHFNHPGFFIRSVASRGSLGGLSEKIIEVTEVMKSFPFDYLFIETVGVGQSEVEIAGLADLTTVVLVPESGDGVQMMKAGLLEVADVFVINKADRPGAERLVSELTAQLELAGKSELPMVTTTAVEGKGVAELLKLLSAQSVAPAQLKRKNLLLADKVYRLIARERMKGFPKEELLQALQQATQAEHFNLFRFARQFLNS